jgi:mono/diheme cytochrome c family protein
MVKVRRFIMMLLGLALMYACGSDKSKTSTTRQNDKPKATSKPKTDPGKIVYMQFCLSCHMENGEGVPGLYHPLSQTKYVLGDKEWLIKNVLLGQQGPIEVKGQHYNNIMTKLDFLRDKQIAEVLTYVRSNFGNSASAVTEEEVRKVRASLKEEK